MAGLCQDCGVSSGDFDVHCRACGVLLQADPFDEQVSKLGLVDPDADAGAREEGNSGITRGVPYSVSHPAGAILSGLAAGTAHFIRELFRDL